MVMAATLQVFLSSMATLLVQSGEYSAFGLHWQFAIGSRFQLLREPRCDAMKKLEVLEVALAPDADEIMQPHLTPNF